MKKRSYDWEGARRLVVDEKGGIYIINLLAEKHSSFKYLLILSVRASLLAVSDDAPPLFLPRWGI